METQTWKLIRKEGLKYSIEESSRRPDAPPFDSPPTVVMYLVSWSLWAMYFLFRYRNLPVFDGAVNDSWWLVVLILLAEFLPLLPSILSSLQMSLYLFFGTRNKYRPSYRLVGEEAPTIDVCITCCGENIDIIMDTVSGAATQDYPSTRFRVFVLDDFKDGKLEKAIDDYNHANCTSVHYLARTKLPDESHFYKAGNLRFGLTATENMGDGSVYFASLDVDMIPEPDWLRRVIPHLILDDGMALACPAQWHYNLPAPDLLGQAGPASMEIFEPMHDNIGCSHCFGSGYIVRRSALKQIGGWPKVPVGEDIFCSYMLAGHGWRIAFVKEFVQYGLTAGSFEALSKQRMRWADGDLLLMKGINFFNPARDPAPQRTVPQRLSAIIKILRGHTAATDCIAMVLLPVTLWIASFHSGEPAAKGLKAGGDKLRLLLMATILADKLSYGMIYWKVGRQTESRFWAVPWTMARMMYLMLPKAIVSFTATGTVKSAVNERDARRRKGIASRLLSPVMIAYLVYTVAALISLASVLLHGMGKEVQGTGAVVRLVECIFKVSVPLRYMAFPPTVAERRDLMEKDELGVYRPKNKYKLKVSRRVTWLDVAEVATILVLGWC